MKLIFAIAFLVLTIIAPVKAQVTPLYNQLIKEAWGLYLSKDYKKSAEKYSEAFTALGNHGLVSDRYNAACVWALCSIKDSSFNQLFKAAELNYTNYDHLINDTDLNSLHKDPRWVEIKELILKNKSNIEANFDHNLVAILDTIYRNDQDYRLKINWYSEQFGWNSEEMNQLWDTIDHLDSINLIKVEKILNNRGWLGPETIGKQGNTTLFLVIQHSNLETQEKYLPMMREAVQNGNALGSSLASLEDRVAVKNGKKQIYGTQLGKDQETGEYFVFPLDAPEGVDERRLNMGMPTMKEYLSNWNLNWDAEEYKKMLPEIEKKMKENK